MSSAVSFHVLSCLVLSCLILSQHCLVSYYPLSSPLFHQSLTVPVIFFSSADLTVYFCSGTTAASKKPGSKAVEIDDVSFHRCVRLGNFDVDRSITFIPPDGEFELMKYRVTDKLNQPFKVIFCRCWLLSCPCMLCCLVCFLVMCVVVLFCLFLVLYWFLSSLPCRVFLLFVLPCMPCYCKLVKCSKWPTDMYAQPIKPTPWRWFQWSRKEKAAWLWTWNSSVRSKPISTQLTSPSRSVSFFRLSFVWLLSSCLFLLDFALPSWPVLACPLASARCLCSVLCSVFCFSYYCCRVLSCLIWSGLVWGLVWSGLGVLFVVIFSSPVVAV